MHDFLAQISRPIRIVGTLLVSFLMVWGITRAAGSQFDAQVAQIQQQAQADQKRLGLDIVTHRKELFDQHPCKPIQLAKIVTAAPGETAEIVATGEFPAGTRFLFDSDDVEVVKETASAAARRTVRYGAAFLPPATTSAAGYRATLRVSPKATFGFVHLHAFVPVSAGHTVVPALFIGGKNNWEVTASNGWRVSLKMQGNGFTLQENKGAEGRYSAEFFKAGETKPFETMEAVMTLQSFQADRNLTFSLSEAPSPYEAEMKQMSAKMSDPSFFVKLTEKEQEKFMNRFGELQAKMMENVQAMVTNPAAANQKQAEFGCHMLQMWGVAGKGTLSCGEKVGRLDVTGTMTLVANQAPAKK